MLFLILLHSEELELVTAPDTLGVIQFDILKVGFKPIADHKGQAFFGVDNLVIFLS
jgi:hypothetical protein